MRYYIELAKEEFDSLQPSIQHLEVERLVSGGQRVILKICSTAVMQHILERLSKNDT